MRARGRLFVALTLAAAALTLATSAARADVVRAHNDAGATGWYPDQPVLASVVAPTTEELFMAQAGTGASLNGEPILASPGEGLAGASAMAPKRFLQRLAELDSQVVALPRIGSLALRLARVAQGRLDLCITGANSHDWDLAAADLLVHEAGGALTTLAGDPLVYNRSHPVHDVLIAAGRARHAALIGLMRDGQMDRS